MAFEIIVQTPVHTIFIALFFHFLKHSTTLPKAKRPFVVLFRLRCTVCSPKIGFKLLLPMWKEFVFSEKNVCCVMMRQPTGSLAFAIT